MLPAEMGYSLPPEWAPQAAVLLSWPLKPGTWPGVREEALAAYTRFAAELSRRGELLVNATPEAHPEIRATLARADATLANIRLLPHPTDDAWVRDHGPIGLLHDDTGELALLDWHYNAWGGKFPPWKRDDAVPRLSAETLALPHLPVDLVGEGGAIEVNGEGLLLTTESVFLNQNRNPALSRDEIERRLKGSLGVRSILWLPAGMKGDDTDGHIDTLTRFIAPRRVVTIVPARSEHPHYAQLAQNREILTDYRFVDGGRLEILELPCPPPIQVEGWREEILPASYANFLVTNEAIFAPTYRAPREDEAACKILAAAFPSRELVPIDCREILLEGGALHCLSMQVPRPTGGADTLA